MATKDGPSLVDVTTLEHLDAETFGAEIHGLLSSISNAIFKDFKSADRPFPISKLISPRAAEPPTVTAISSAMQPPFKDAEIYYLAWVAFYEVVVDLPLEVLEHYRPVLDSLASKPNASDEDVAKYKCVMSLRDPSASLLRFMNDPTAVWAPEDKSDYVAERSLQERVTTPEEMVPHVPRLLGWLADSNWPPYRGCWEQLARFPEVTVGPIGELLKKERDDGGLVLSLLEFVNQCVPVGKLWTGLRPRIEEFAKRPTAQDLEWDIPDLAQDMLAELDDWEKERRERMANAS
ncbi:hypothetical protein ABW20_dc0105630 [Dactylellina cionopaga]|nr:hypothetical protein ABW20_dc0105630 [Dactylellina cionopaga]